jgi:hypothetical protein
LITGAEAVTGIVSIGFTTNDNAASKQIIDWENDFLASTYNSKSGHDVTAHTVHVLARSETACAVANSPIDKYKK